MIASERPSRRGVLVRLAIFVNGVAGAALAIPIVRYLLSPVARGEKPGSGAWVPLGQLEEFPPGETRYATYRSPVVMPSDGETANLGCWVRNVDGRRFQVFAVNCAHLGCPVRWFPQSNLFMCPCHGGAYYADGSRASGPPERGLFEQKYKLEKGRIFIQAGALPTPGSELVTLNVRRRPWA